MRSMLRFSILELLALLLVPGLGIAAVKAGGYYASIALLAGMLGFFAIAVASLFGNARTRAFSSGFVVAAGLYAALLLYFGEIEFRQGAGRLPTTQLLSPLYDSVATSTYEMRGTGASMTKAEVDAYMVGRTPQMGSAVREIQSPSLSDFMVIGHLLIASLLGYLGGKLAVALKCRSDCYQSATQS